VFQGFEIDGNSDKTGGIYIAHPHTGSSIDNITIDDCVVHDVGDPLDDAYIYGILVGSKSSGGAATTSNIIITDNTVYNCDHEGIALYPAWTVSGQKLDTVLVRGNTIYDSVDGGFAGLAINNDSDNVTVEFNTIYGCPMGIDIRTSSDSCANVGGGATNLVTTMFKTYVFAIRVKNPILRIFTVI
jgi:hypothetical protein